MIEKKKRTRSDVFREPFGSYKGGWRFQAWQEINGGGFSALSCPPKLAPVVPD